jgi:hypothetical protein
VRARRAISIVVSMIARDVAHVAQACTPTREFNRAPALVRSRTAEGKWQVGPPLLLCARIIPVYDITLSNASFKGLQLGAFFSLELSIEGFIFGKLNTLLGALFCKISIGFSKYLNVFPHMVLWYIIFEWIKK